jgi:hypothetical protein
MTVVFIAFLGFHLYKILTFLEIVVLDDLWRLSREPSGIRPPSFVRVFPVSVRLLASAVHDITITGIRVDKLPFTRVDPLGV